MNTVSTKIRFDTLFSTQIQVKIRGKILWRIYLDAFHLSFA